MKWQSLFWKWIFSGKNKKNISLSSAELTQIVVLFKIIFFLHLRQQGKCKNLVLTLPGKPNSRLPQQDQPEEPQDQRSQKLFHCNRREKTKVSTVFTQTIGTTESLLILSWTSSFYYLLICLKVFWMGDKQWTPVHKLHTVASYFGLHCLSLPPLRVNKVKKPCKF